MLSISKIVNIIHYEKRPTEREKFIGPDTPVIHLNSGKMTCLGKTRSKRLLFHHSTNIANEQYRHIRDILPSDSLHQETCEARTKKRTEYGIWDI